MLFLCALLSVSARKHICTYCKNRLQQYTKNKYWLCTYDTVALNILWDMKFPLPINLSKAIVAYEGRSTAVVESILSQVISSVTQGNYANHNVDLILWIYER